MVKKTTRNPYIELYRFIGALLIMTHHSYRVVGVCYALGGWVFTEFFFMLSGFLMTKHFDTALYDNANIERLSVFYVFRKLRTLIPYAWLGIVIHIFSVLGTEKLPIQKVPEMLSQLPFDLFFLKVFKIGGAYDLVPPLWFVSGLLFAMPGVCIMMQRKKSLYKYLLSWLIPCIMYFLLYSINGYVNYWEKNWALNCLFRSIAGIVLGSLCYYSTNRLKQFRESNDIKIAFSILEAVIVAILVLFSFDGRRVFDMPGIMCCFLLILLSFSRVSCQKNKFALISEFLGKLSLPMYCLHTGVFIMVDRVISYKMKAQPKMLIAFAATIIFSAISILVVEGIKKKQKQR